MFSHPLPGAPLNQIAIAVLGLLLVPASHAASCLDLGLSRMSRMVLQVREAGFGERPAVTYRDAEAQAWFVPLRGEHIGEGRTDRQSCTLDNLTYWRLPVDDRSLTLDTNADVLSFLDVDQTTQVIDGRKPDRKSTRLNSSHQ